MFYFYSDLSTTSIEIDTVDHEVSETVLKPLYIEEKNINLSDATSGSEEAAELEVIPESPKSEGVDTITDKKLNMKDDSVDKKTSSDILKTDEQFNKKDKNLSGYTCKESATTSDSKKDQSTFSTLKHKKLTKMAAIDESIKFQKENDRFDDNETSESRELEITIDANPAHPISIIEKIAIEDKNQVKQSFINSLKSFSTDQQAIEKSNKSTETFSFAMPNQSIIPSKPLPERLLPIGLTTTKNKKFIHQLGTDKKTQTQDLINSLGLIQCEIPLPPAERLLPIGPIKPYKSHFPTSVRRFISPLIMKEKIKDVEKSNNLLNLKSHSLDELKYDQDKNQNMEEEKLELSNFQKEFDYKKPSLDIDKPSSALTFNEKARENESFVKVQKVERKSVNKNIESSKPTKSNISLFLPLDSKLAKEISHLESRKQLSQESSDDDIKNEKQALGRKANENPNKNLTELNARINMADCDLLTKDVNQTESQTDDQKNLRLHYKLKKKKKSGLNTSEHSIRSMESRNNAHSSSKGTSGVQRRSRKVESSPVLDGPSKRSSASQSSMTFREETTYEKCFDCGNIIEEFSEEEIGMCIVILGAYIHHEPGMAAPILPEILKLVAKFALSVPYSWQYER